MEYFQQNNPENQILGEKEFGISRQNKFIKMISNQCSKESHDNQKIKYLCIDPQCTTSDKLGCADCFLQDHISHHRVHTEEFFNQASTKITELKTTQCDNLYRTITELNETIDQEFDNCAGAILQRFDTVKGAIKQSIEADAQVIQSKQDAVNQEIEADTMKINSLIERPLYELSDEQVLQLTNIYNDFNIVQARHQLSIDLLKQEREHIKAKNQKHLRKLNQVVNTLLREFGDKLSPLKDSENEGQRCATPEKKTKAAYSQNSATKSPPNIVEMVRSGRRSTQTLNQIVVERSTAAQVKSGYNKKLAARKRVSDD